MSKLLTGLVKNYWVLLLVLFAAAALINGSAQYEAGYRSATAIGEKALADLRLEHERLRADVAEEALARLQVEQQRVLTAEAELLKARAELANKTQQLTRERIAHVSKQSSTGGTGLITITCGWLREYNAALGADLQAPAGCAVDPHAETTTWHAAGSDAELQPADVALADVLAHARDYGQWALATRAQLNALLDLLDKEQP